MVRATGDAIVRVVFRKNIKETTINTGIKINFVGDMNSLAQT